MNGPARHSQIFRTLTKSLLDGNHCVILGPIDDAVLLDGQVLDWRAALDLLLHDMGYRLVTQYNLMDGLQALRPEGQAWLDDLVAPSQPPPVAPLAIPAGNGTEEDRRARAMRAVANVQQSGFQQHINRRDRTDAFAAMRRLMSQTGTPTASIIDLVNAGFGNPDWNEADRQAVSQLRLAMREAAYVGRLRNIIVMLAGSRSRLPAAIHEHDPRIVLLEHGLPNRAERLAVAQAQDKPVNAELLEGLADASDGLHNWEVIQIMNRVDPDQPINAAELVRRFRHGVQDNPWTAIASRVASAPEFLGRAVVGQQHAVTAVSDALAAACLGFDMEQRPEGVGRPRATFLFLGPTGVGKTELAKSLAQFIFGAQDAYIRFDMSNFQQEHSAEMLAGAPPGYIGHEAGGQLTNAIIRQPFSVVLFDEIEKAHRSVFRKFLQILDDGILTDGLGRTAHFGNTVIIFTSNQGADRLYEAMRAKDGDLTFEQVSAISREEAEHFFSRQLGMPELLGRLDSDIVPFDVLRPNVIPEITAKFLANVRLRTGPELMFDQASTIEFINIAMRQTNNILLGGRQIRNLLQSRARAVAGWIARCAPTAKSVNVTVRADGSCHIETDDGIEGEISAI